MELYEPVAPFEVVTAVNTDVVTPKRTSLPSMLPPAWAALACVLSERGSSGLPCCSAQPQISSPTSKQKHHDLIQHPAVARPADHQSVSVGESGRQHRDGQHLDEVRQRRRVLVGMSAVGVEEAAAVSPQVLDDFQRRHGSLGDGLPRAVESR